MKAERIDLLVVGLPVAAFKAKKRGALERLVLGKHDVGRGKTVQVERARVVPQPQGALVYYGHVHNRVAEIRKERSLIIDPGARTFDWLVTQGMQLVEKKSHSVNRGMFDVLQAIAGGISKAMGTQFRESHARTNADSTSTTAAEGEHSTTRSPPTKKPSTRSNVRLRLCSR